MIVSGRHLVATLGLVVLLGGCASAKAPVQDGALTPRLTEYRLQSTTGTEVQTQFVVQEPTKPGCDGTLDKHPWIVLVALLIFTFTVTK
jgi:hypothetical protein